MDNTSMNDYGTTHCHVSVGKNNYVISLRLVNLTYFYILCHFYDYTVYLYVSMNSFLYYLILCYRRITHGVVTNNDDDIYFKSSIQLSSIYYKTIL